MDITILLSATLFRRPGFRSAFSVFRGGSRTAGFFMPIGAVGTEPYEKRFLFSISSASAQEIGAFVQPV